MGTGPFIPAVLLALLAAACGRGDGAGASVPGPAASPFLDEYHAGVVFTPGIRPFHLQLEDMASLEADTAKFWLDWSAVQPEALYYAPAGGRVSASSGEGFRWPQQEDLSADPGLVDAYAFPEGPDGRFLGRVDWAAADALVFGLAEAGISPLPLIGDATTAPRVRGHEVGLRMAPEPEGWESVSCGEGGCSGYVGVGREAYLGQIALHAAGAARRYRGVVRLWNTENELNWTPVHVLVAGWREGRAWFDGRFLASLLQTLYQAVHLGGGEGTLAAMNFNVHDPFWLSRLRDWLPFVDVAGLGAYPNYLFPEPVLDRLLLDAVDRALEAVDRPVMVLETGYPAGPGGRGYSEALQTHYLERTARAVRDRGCLGYLWYRLDDPPYDPAAGALQAVEAFWGLVDAEGLPKRSFEAFRGLAREEAAPQGRGTHPPCSAAGLPIRISDTWETIPDHAARGEAR